MKTIFFIITFLFININCNAQFVDDKLDILVRSFNKSGFSSNMNIEPLFKFEQYILDSVCKNKQDSALFIKNRRNNITIWIRFKHDDLKANHLVKFFIDYQKRFPDVYLNIYYIDSNIENYNNFLDTIHNRCGVYPNIKYLNIVHLLDIDSGAYYSHISYQLDLDVNSYLWSVQGHNYYSDYNIDNMLNYIDFIRFYKQFVYLPYVKHNLDKFSKDLINSLENKGLDISDIDKEKITKLAIKEMEH